MKTQLPETRNAIKRTTTILITLLVVHHGFSQSTDPAPYCDASFDDLQGLPVDDHISNVTFGSLSNPTNSQYAAPHYVFYNNLSIPNFTTGTSYDLDLTFKVAGSNGYGVWIDYNHDNAFEASEKVAGTSGHSFLPFGTDVMVSNTVLIPTSATSGNTRMRVRIVEDDMYNATTTSELPCNASTSASDVMDWGETEDYTIQITSSTGITEMGSNTSVDLFPNPSNGNITVRQRKATSIGIRITNVAGEVVRETEVMGLHTTIDLAGQPKGVYLVRITNNDKSVTNKKLIIQ